MSSHAIHRASRLGSIGVSEIVQISERAKALREQGRDVIGLGTGEPDFDTPEHIKDAATAAMRAGDTKYPVNVGSLVLREAIRDKFSRENSLEFGLDEIIVSTGAKQVLFNVFMSSLEPGDEVIVPAPYWTSYVDIVAVCGGEARIVETDASSDFKMSGAMLEAAIGPKTRWLLLNSPSNPSGAAYRADELRELADVLVRHPHVGVVSDEIYEHLVYGNFVFKSFRSVAPELADRTLIVNGVSKAYAMTGWRLGYGAGPAELIRNMNAVQGQATSGASSISQAAATAALNGPQEIVVERKDAFDRRRLRIVAKLNECDGVDCPTPDGAFYVFPSCIGTFGKRTPEGKRLETDADFCAYLLDREGVAVVPGRAFGCPGHFRISYAYAQTDLDEACARIKRACGELTQ